MAIFGKHGHHKDDEAQQHEDLTQYVHDSIRHMPHDDTGGRLGQEEGAGAEIMAEALEGFEQHLHHPEWHPGRSGATAPREAASSEAASSEAAGRPGVDGETGATHPD